MKRRKSGSPSKRRKTHVPTQLKELREHARKMRDNAGLLLRVVAWLVEHAHEAAEQYDARGDVRIPLAALTHDVDVGMAVEGDVLVIAPAPLVSTDQMTVRLTREMVRDLLGLGGKYATLEQIDAWTDEQREQAAEWGAQVHANAAVEEPPFPKMPEVAAHIQALPDIIGIDFANHKALTHLRYPDGREETIETEISR